MISRYKKGSRLQKTDERQSQWIQIAQQRSEGSRRLARTSPLLNLPNPSDSPPSLKHNGNRHTPMPWYRQGQQLSKFFNETESESSVHARRVANSLIRHARRSSILMEHNLLCQTCGRLPVQPVACQCGVTRCLQCTENGDYCSCGFPRSIHVDLTTRQIVNNIVASVSRISEPENVSMIASFIDDPFSSSLASMSRKVPKSLRVQTNRPCRDVRSIMASRLPMAPEVRMRFAESLFKAGHLKEGVVQIAKIAAQCSGHSRIARMYLIKTIKKLASGRDPRRLLRELYQLIGNHDTSSWLRNEDIECKLCYEYFRRPLTLSCGHTFCRACIERLLDYRIPCPMCRNYLDEMEIAETSESMFLTAVLGNLGIVDDGRLCADEIYILNCIVAFPGIPCPLVVFDPKYKRMVYRALQSGTRQLGILSCNELDYESNNLCGTIVEVCDCVFLENGHCILSTVGVSRFHVLRLSAIAGCDVARIEPIEDIRIRGRLINNINQLALETWQEARDWFTSVHWKVKKSIEDTFGLMPEFLNYVDEVVLKDGPSWLWWFIAILPLREELRALILATPSLKKRLLAVKRTLEAIHEPPTGNIESTESEVYLTLNEDCHEWRSNPTSGRKA